MKESLASLHNFFSPRKLANSPSATSSWILIKERDGDALVRKLSFHSNEDKPSISSSCKEEIQPRNYLTEKDECMSKVSESNDRLPIPNIPTEASVVRSDHEQLILNMTKSELCSRESSFSETTQSSFTSLTSSYSC